MPIKGLGSIGKDIFDLRHIMVDEAGKVIIDKAGHEVAQKGKKEEKALAEW